MPRVLPQFPAKMTARLQTLTLFLPAAGIYNDGNSNVNDQGNNGYYWSTDNKRYLNFNNGNRNMNNNNPNNGMTVRPVSALTSVTPVFP